MAAGDKKIVLRTMDANKPETCVKLDRFDSVDDLAMHLNFNNQPEDGFYFIKDADLSGLKLNAGLRIKKLQLENVKLQRADLKDVMISHVCFRKVDFSGAVMRAGMMLGGELEDCRFDGADMEGASLMRLKITGGSFRKADLNSGVLESSRFMNVAMNAANMNGCDLRRTSWLGCDLRGAQTDDLEDFNEFTVLNSRYDSGFARQMKGLSSYNPRVSPGRMHRFKRKPAP